MNRFQKIIICLAAIITAFQCSARRVDEFRFYSDTILPGIREGKIVLRAESDSLKVFQRFHFEFFPVAHCSLKNISDSLYVIHYNPMETSQWKHEVTIKTDTTLEERTRVIIRAPNLAGNYLVKTAPYEVIDDLYIKDGIFIYDYQNPFGENPKFEFGLREFRFVPNFYPLIGLQPYAIEYPFSCPREIYLSEGNQVIEFYFPELSDWIFEEYYINLKYMTKI